VSGIKINSRALLLAGLLALITLAAYWPACHYDFVDYDDDSYVFENDTVRAGLSWWGLEWAVVDQHASNWHPLTWVSHMLDCQLFGLNAGAHHLTSVFIHCANAALLLLLLHCMTGALWRSAFVAALFALHPLRVESVAWIAERKDVLSGFFFMLTLWTYALHVKNQSLSAASGPAAKSPCRRFYRWSLFFFLLGLLSKPMLVTVPLVLLLLDFWPLQRFETFKLKVSNSGTPVKKPATINHQLATLFFEKWPFFLLSIVFSLITLLVQWSGLAAQNGGIGSRLAGMMTAYLGYLEKLFWPRDLTFLYLRPPTIPVGSLLLAALVLTGVSALAAACVKRRPYLIVGWLWFLGMLLPVSGVIPLARLFIADRYTYLPAIGFFVMVTWGIADMTGKFLPRRPCRILTVAGATTILFLCLALTRHQLAFWQNTGTLMEHALRIDPDNYVAQINLRIYRFEKEHPGVREKKSTK
jgi:hypothetical protein